MTRRALIRHENNAFHKKRILSSEASVGQSPTLVSQLYVSNFGIVDPPQNQERPDFCKPLQDPIPWDHAWMTERKKNYSSIYTISSPGYKLDRRTISSNSVRNIISSI